jgi:TonB family protein
MYDQEKAESWIEPYEKDLPQHEREFQQLLEGLAKTDGQLVLRKVNDDPEPGKGMEWGMLHSAKAPLDIYFAAWKTEANQNGRPVAIGYFYFIDGKFRWDSLILVFSIPLNKPATPPAIVLQNSTVSVPAGKPREGVLPPKVLQSVPAQYTDTARLARLEGTVLLSTIIDTLGRPQNIKVVRSLGEGLDEKAVDALRLWTFSPATRDGKPFPSQAEIEIRFKLYDKK